MKQLELLAAKPVVRAAPTEVVCSVIVSGGTYRLRIAIGTQDFKDLYDASAGSPKSNVYGEVNNGLAVVLSSHHGLGLTYSGKDAIGLAVSAKAVGSTENKVERRKIPAVLAEYEDKSTALFIAPLPDTFLSTKARKTRLPVPKALIDAFGVADLAIPTYREAAISVVAPLVFEKSAPTVAAAAPVVVAPPVVSVPIQDLRDLLEMVNSGVRELRASGAMVTLRVDDDGAIRGKIVREEEL